MIMVSLLTAILLRCGTRIVHKNVCRSIRRTIFLIQSYTNCRSSRRNARCAKVVFKASVKQNKKHNNKLKYHVTFGGPDVHKLQKTAEIAGFDVSGSHPESEIKEIEATKMKAKFPKKKIPMKKEP